MGDIHNREGKLESSMKKLRNGELSQKNKELLEEYKYHLEAEKKSTSRVSRYIQSFNALTPHIDFDLDQATKKDLIRLTSKINKNKVKEKDLSPYTLNEYRKALKSFYKWETGEDEPEIIDFITIGVSKREKPDIQADELPQPEDVKKILQKMQNPRDKAFVLVLWETGGRISEILNIKWKDITEYDDYAKIKFTESKTQQRSVPVKECITLLKNWKTFHKNPARDQYVFTGLDTTSQISYKGMSKQMAKAVEKTDIQQHKRTNFHAFRKGRATFLASKSWNIFQLMEFFGWDKPKTALEYIKLANSNIDEAFMKLHRQTQLEEYEDSELTEEEKYFVYEQQSQPQDISMV